MKQSVLADLRKQARKGHLADDLSIVYRVFGGSHGADVDETIALGASGAVRVRVLDKLGRKQEGDARDELGKETVVELVRLIDRGVEGLIPRSEAQFLPDSLVGSVQIGLGDRTETYYFHADEAQREHAGAAKLSDEASKLLSCFDDIENRCLKHGGVQ